MKYASSEAIEESKVQAVHEVQEAQGVREVQITVVCWLPRQEKVHQISEVQIKEVHEFRDVLVNWSWKYTKSVKYTPRRYLRYKRRLRYAR